MVAFNDLDFVVVFSDGAVNHYASDGSFRQQLYAAGAENVRSVAFGTDRSLYVTLNFDQIDKWDPDGTGPTTIFTTGVTDRTPEEIWAPDDDTLIVSVNQASGTGVPRLFQLQTDGTLIKDFGVLDNGPGDDPTYNDHALIGVTADGAHLYTQWAEIFDVGDFFTQIRRINVSTEVMTVIVEEQSASNNGDYWDLAALADGGFGAISVNGGPFPPAADPDRIVRFDADGTNKQEIARADGANIIVGATTYTGVTIQINELRAHPSHNFLCWLVRTPTSLELWQYDLDAEELAARIDLDHNESGLSFAMLPGVLHPGIARHNPNDDTQDYFVATD